MPVPSNERRKDGVRRDRDDRPDQRPEKLGAALERDAYKDLFSSEIGQLPCPADAFPDISPDLDVASMFKQLGSATDSNWLRKIDSRSSRTPGPSSRVLIDSLYEGNNPDEDSGPRSPAADYLGFGFTTGTLPKLPR